MPGQSAFTLEDFWGGSLVAQDENKIEPAFTLKGMKALQSFFQEMENALVDPVIIAGNKLAFQDWYRKKYFDAWHAFGVSFLRGADRLKGKTEWRQTASVMGTEKNPYFAFLDRITKEMMPFQR